MLSRKEIIRKRRSCVENGALLFARLTPKPVFSLENFPILGENLETGAVVEISGPIASGKTTALINLSAFCIAPTTTGGLETNVYYIDCDRQMDIKRLVAVLKSQLSPNRNPLPFSDPVFKTSLTRFHYLACDDTAEFLHSFEFLDRYFASPALLIVDGINSYYWLDRTSQDRGNVFDRQQACILRLRRFLAEHNSAAVVSRLVMEYKDSDQAPESPGTGKKPKFASSTSMASLWSDVVTKTIELSFVESAPTMRRAVSGSAVTLVEISQDGSLTYSRTA